MRVIAGLPARCNTGHELGIWREDDDMPPTAGDIDTITQALKPVVRHGLPIADDLLDESLTDLYGVIARSVHPEERVSCTDSFNSLLPRLIDTIEADFDRKAARVLFGIEQGTSGTTLTARRARAANIGNYDPDHFRKRLEPKLVREVGLRLHKDSLRYKTHTRRAPRALEPTGGTPKLTDDDLTAQEEHISRIWSEVYGLRAELIAAARKSVEPEYESQVEDHRQAVRTHEDRLRVLVEEYVGTYGDRFIRHGDIEYDAEALQRLATWTLD